MCSGSDHCVLGPIFQNFKRLPISNVAKPSRTDCCRCPSVFQHCWGEAKVTLSGPGAVNVTYCYRRSLPSLSELCIKVPLSFERLHGRVSRLCCAEIMIRAVSTIRRRCVSWTISRASLGGRLVWHTCLTDIPTIKGERNSK